MEMPIRQSIAEGTMNNRKTKSEFIDDMVAADGGIRGYHRAIRRKWAVLGILVISAVFM